MKMDEHFYLKVFLQDGFRSRLIVQQQKFSVSLHLINVDADRLIFLSYGE